MQKVWEVYYDYDDGYTQDDSFALFKSEEAANACVEYERAAHHETFSQYGNPDAFPFLLKIREDVVWDSVEELNTRCRPQKGQ